MDQNMLITIVGNVIVCAVGYGSLIAKVTRLERDVESHQEDDKEVHKGFVSKDMFDAVIVRLRADLAEMKADMKEILSIIHNQARE